jgi:archaellum biogenesis protein FlaJ (TadC family)
VRCSVVIVVVVIVVIIIIIIITINIDVVVFIVVVIVVLLLVPTSFYFLLSSWPLVLSGNILFNFCSGIQSAFMKSQTSFQSFINSINRKWIPPTLKSLEISFRKIGEERKLQNSHK